VDVGILRIWRRSRLEKDADLHTERSLEGLSSGLLAQGNLVTRALGLFKVTTARTMAFKACEFKASLTA
jgi:hypothetical protein